MTVTRGGDAANAAENAVKPPRSNEGRENVYPVIHASNDAGEGENVRTPSIDLTALSPRRRQVALLVAEGYSNDEIARRIGMSLGTVCNYVNAMYRSYDISAATGITARVRLSRLIWQASVAELVADMLAERRAG